MTDRHRWSEPFGPHPRLSLRRCHSCHLCPRCRRTVCCGASPTRAHRSSPFASSDLSSPSAQDRTPLPRPPSSRNSWPHGRTTFGIRAATLPSGTAPPPAGAVLFLRPTIARSGAGSSLPPLSPRPCHSFPTHMGHSHSSSLPVERTTGSHQENGPTVPGDFASRRW